MYWLRWFGFSCIGIGIASAGVIPWLRAHGRGDETLDAVIGAIVALAVGMACLLWRRDRGM
ncbi:hypothetical protein [Jiangella anatolica]|uniref:Uncharacterized protein n=1 Tax=Jiangella anatolica TaxID=2670374 RepID=A0A2W2B5J5_9ACTN|nr:hypothetical protein [Jiangella anatolica]PZF82711.1 hypothetical protein C1I92_15765 [Jiangella anatolica]